jgi:glycine oxidase
MVSPGMEAVLEGGGAQRYDLFRRAYAAWPAFAAGLNLPLTAHGAGAVQLGDTAGLAHRLEALGVEARPVGPAQVRALQPLYGGQAGGLLTPADGRLDPVSTLEALARTVLDSGGALVAEPLAPGPAPGGFDRLVLAAGYDALRWKAVAPEVAALAPIKGHILHYALADPGGATLRGADGYLAPQAGGFAFGATMEAGRADRTVDPEIAARLHAAAVSLAPALAHAARVARAGVRAATPDGLPLVGASVGGAILAVGARRNGWLLAPLVVEAVLAALAGDTPWPAFDPARFSRT